jgi:hypothetical protein
MDIKILFHNIISLHTFSILCISLTVRDQEKLSRWHIDIIKETSLQWLVSGLILLLLFVLSMTINTFFNNDTKAQPLSSFPRQEITVGIRDGLQVVSNKQTKADYKDKLDNSSDIQKVTYFGDGKILNTTLWLGDTIPENPSADGANSLVYGILIDVDNNPTTGKFGVDYQKEIQWSNTTQQWNNFIAEYSSPGHLRILESQRNSSIISEENQKYVPISLDLELITSPTKYRILCYTVVIYGNTSKSAVDLTNWIDVPPATYMFSTLPNPLVMRQGEQMDIGVQLKSSSGVPPQSVHFFPPENYSSIKVVFNPDKSSNSTSFGLSPAPFTIQVPQDAQVGHYSIPIMANISSGSLFPSEFIELPNFNLSVPIQGYVSTQANLSISVVRPPTISEQVKEFWDTYGEVISLVGAGFAGGISTYVFDYLKNRKKKRAPIETE